MHPGKSFKSCAFLTILTFLASTSIVVRQRSTTVNPRNLIPIVGFNSNFLEDNVEIDRLQPKYSEGQNVTKIIIGATWRTGSTMTGENSRSIWIFW